MPVAPSPLLAHPPAADAGDHSPVYAKYVEHVPPGDVLASLESQLAGTIAVLDEVGEDGAGYRYAPGKWSVR